MTHNLSQNDVALDAGAGVEALVLHGSDQRTKHGHLRLANIGCVQQDAHRLLGARETLDNGGVAAVNPKATVLRDGSVLVDTQVRNDVLRGQPLDLVIGAVAAGDDKDCVSNAEATRCAVRQLRVQVNLERAVWPRDTAPLVSPSQEQRIFIVSECWHGFLPKSSDRIVADVLKNGSLDFGGVAVAGYTNN